MKKTIFAALFLVTACCAQSQSRYVAMSQVETVPYGMVSQLFNGSASTVTLESVEVSGAINTVCDPTCHSYSSADGLLQFGFSLDNTEESQCQAVTGYVLAAATQVAPQDGVRVSQQPCTPNGLTYGVPYTGTGNCGGFNYTCISTVGVKRCWGAGQIHTCTLDLTAATLTLSPGQGVAVWSGRYKNESAFSWQGYVTVAFRWKH